MRIIIDLQIVQLEEEFDGRLINFIKLLTYSLCLNESFEIHLLLNSSLNPSIDKINAYFLPVLQKQNIHIFDIDVTSEDINNDDFNQAVRESFIGQLEASILIIFNYSIQLATKSVISINKYNHVPTIVINYVSSNDSIITNIQSVNFQHLNDTVGIINISDSQIEFDVSERGDKPSYVMKIPISASNANGNFTPNFDFINRELCVYLNCFLHEDSKKDSQPTLVKKRLAYFSPLPPERSGISDYSYELLQYLSKYYDITAIVAQESVEVSLIRDNVKVRRSEWFTQYAKTFDRIIYHIGNSEFHSYMVELLPLFPGIVVLHDFFLSNMYGYMSWKKNPPFALKHNLYHSHGYRALNALEHECYPKQAIWEYPTNLKVVQDSLGIIVHSENSKDLADVWYGKNTSNNWKVIQHLRKMPDINNKAKAKKTLGYPDDAFIICTFGIIGETKLSLEIVEAFVKAELFKKPNTYLILVGKNHTGQYGTEILSVIKKYKAQEKVKITDWIDATEFKTYLQIADLGIQLRTLSRGETSGTVLDCMNYGLPTIVNANGSMAYLDKQSVFMLPDKFKLSELISAIDTLYQSTEIRNILSKNALSTIKTSHDPAKCAFEYYQAIEVFYERQSSKLYNLLYSHINNGDVIIDNEEKISVLANNFPAYPNLKQLFFDVTVLSHTDLKTGIERVTRAMLLTLLKNPPQGWRIEPTYSRLDLGCYYYARKFTLGILNLTDEGIEDTEIEFRKGDIYLNVELNHHHTIGQKKYYQKLQMHGVKLVTLVHDILPVTMAKEYFVPELPQRHANWLNIIADFDQIICVTKAVADDVYEWLNKFSTSKRYTPLMLDWSHSGADIDNTLPTTGMPADSERILAKLNQSITFLAVGTIEPKKGYGQLLKDFELLWNDKIDINLVIVGKAGWNVEDIITNIKQHQELDKKLFWFTGISDEYLENIYEVSDCLIAASYGEGFGLPLVEAAQHGLPIIARDIPVFKEVCGEYATYFSDSEAHGIIAKCVLEWLKLKETNQVPKVENMSWLNWEESTKKLMSLLLNESQPYKTWTPITTKHIT